MDCPICRGKFPAGQIEPHVEQCLIEQDAAMARKVQNDLNANGSSREQAAPPQQRAPAGQAAGFPKSQSSGPCTPAPAHIPHYGPISISSGPVSPQYAPTGPSRAPHTPNSGQQIPPPSRPGANVTGAVQADVDAYNHKIGLSHKQLLQLHDSLESFAHRISLLEIRKHERIIPPVELASLPPPRYMALRSTQPASSQHQAPRGPYTPTGAPQQMVTPNGVVPTQRDLRQRFFQTAQRVYNNKSGANQFFESAAKSASPITVPPSPQPPSTASPYRPPVTEVPAKHAASVVVSHPPIKPAPVHPQPEAGITDIHVAQIESKWISMILQFPDDAEDLILGHLTMLFNQRIKAKKALGDSTLQDDQPQNSTPDSPSKAQLIDNRDGSDRSRDKSKGSSSDPDGMPHPVSEYVSSMIETWSEPFSRMREPTQETIQTAANVVKNLILTLEDVVLDYYKELSVRNVPRNASYQQYAAAEKREQMVRSGVRNAIWPLFHDDLIQLIHAKVSAEDDVCNQKMKEYMTMNPAHLGIPQDYWLLEMSPDAMNADGRAWSIPPYYAAIQTFKELSGLHSPDSKLRCLVKSARDLVKSVASFHSFFGRNPDKYPVGGDELLPIFTYVVIRSGVKNLISEANFMEIFIDDDQARGESGYILATLQTVIAFLSCLDNSSISQSVDSVFKSIAKEMEHKPPPPVAGAPSSASPPPHNNHQLAPPASDNAASGLSHHTGSLGPNIADPSSPHAPSFTSPAHPHSPPPKDTSQHESVELQPIGVQKGSFFENDPSLDTFDGSKSVFEDAGASMTEMQEFNPRS